MFLFRIVYSLTSAGGKWFQVAKFLFLHSERNIFLSEGGDSIPDIQAQIFFRKKIFPTQHFELWHKMELFKAFFYNILLVIYKFN